MIDSLEAYKKVLMKIYGFIRAGNISAAEDVLNTAIAVSQGLLDIPVEEIQNGQLAWCYTCASPFISRKGQVAGRHKYCIKCVESNKHLYVHIAKLRERDKLDPNRERRIRLTSEQRADIYQRCLDNDQGSKERGFKKKLAKEFGISESAVYKIAEGRIPIGNPKD